MKPPAYFELPEYSRQLGGPPGDPIVHFRYPRSEEKSKWSFMEMGKDEVLMDV
eukprot:CAMPEP_0170489180 /NCGR_PEP_ID=MMETSP0208-20121228/7570_1 /TAXON_ID=197538 /ORGANISM="Strombidium inclinatum, Strain S3" /LENGTH=52 /DNA_ID=CAMNT_0010763997 /DNA_START=778 /DNA_END=932 /DNA_ORIENTATION=+